MSIETIKEKARKFEQKEEWQEALDLYLQAIDRLEGAEEADISLFNRVGDLEVRMDRVEDAVEHYERAVDLYMDAELPNNAIAVCKKVARNFPNQHSIFLKMGQIRASQGFLTDARQNYLKFAEEKQNEGDIEAALDALIQFVELAPEDIEIRLALAEQLAQHDRVDEAVEQFQEARRRLILDGREEEADGVAGKIRELSPDVEVADAEAIRAAGPAEVPSAAPVEDAWESSFSDFSSDEEEEAPAGDEAEPEEEEEAAEIEGDFSEFSIGGEDEEEVEGAGKEPAEVAADTLEDVDVGEDQDEGFGKPEDEADEGGDFDLGDEDDELEDEGGDLPTFGFGEDEEDEAVAVGEAPEKTPEEDAEDEEALDASAFGVREEGDHSELPDLETELEDISDGAEEEAEEEEGREPAAEEPAAEAVEEAVEEEAGDDWLAAVDAGAEEAPVEAPPEAEEEEAPVEEAAAEERPEALRRRGLELLEEGEENEADRLLERAHARFAEAGRMDEAIETLEARIEARPDDVELRQRLVEYAYQTTQDDPLVSAYLGLAGTLRNEGEERKARSVYQQVLDTDPENEEAQRALAELSGEGGAEPEARKEVASSEEYVDLGSLVLDDEEEEKSTRFTVAADAPSGDEQADFNKMLDQFKDKIAENVSADDVTAHYDLGTAYKEMGLVNEAISEFQAALRAARDHLPTYEMLGQCFMEKGEYRSAARTLKKALDSDYEVEDELLGIYYFLGRAYEEMGDDDQAAEYYDRVFELDINFMDVTERLRELR